MKKRKNEKQIKFQRTTMDSTYNGKPIITDRSRGLACRTDILEKIEERIEYATQRYSRVMCTRMDLRFPYGYHAPECNKLVSLFLAKYIRYLKRNGNAPQYVCVREQSREKHQHYHLILLTNQKNHQFPHRLISKAEELWASTLGVSDGRGLVDHCTKSRSGEKQRNSYRLNRNDPDFEKTMAECFRRCSYLAKNNTKGNQPKHKHELFCSRVPKIIK